MVYSEFVNAIADLLVILATITDPTLAAPSTDTNFNVILPRAIEAAEQRMYRELDLIQTTSIATSALTTNVRQLTIPGSLIVMNSCYLVTPAGSAPTAADARRNPMIRVSLDYLNRTYPYGQATITGQIPKYYASIDETTIQVGPAPDSNYTVEFYGIVRPAALSNSNTSTILTTYLPDLFIAASMVFLSAYQRDWGAMSDDPKLAMSWEANYQTLKAGAKAEIARAKSMSAQWTPLSVPEMATATTRGSPN